MINVYIGQPMQFKTDREIENTREEIEEWVKQVRHPNSDVNFINRYNPEWADIPPLDALGRAITLMSKADVAYFAPGWEHSRGCQIEVACCDAYGIPWSFVTE